MSLQQTVNWTPWIFGEDGVALDDAAEAFHEASRYSRAMVDNRVRGQTLLQRSPQLRASTRRASARNHGAATVALPHTPSLSMPLGVAIATRRSRREHATDSLSLRAVAQLLRAAYGRTGSGADGIPLRAVPSAGALYPLDVYVAARAVDGLSYDLHHYDPLRDVLEIMRPLRPEELEPLTPYPELVQHAAAVVLVAAVFWRSRVKYGQRGYRFALLEAGHVTQNLLLAGTALDLAAVPLGGFFDRQVNEFLGLDGVHEAALYIVPITAVA
jgi:SagB-type dehydrogenase family enzyme